VKLGTQNNATGSIVLRLPWLTLIWAKERGYPGFVIYDRWRRKAIYVNVSGCLTGSREEWNP
jgi:hypothetical protein